LTVIQKVVDKQGAKAKFHGTAADECSSVGDFLLNLATLQQIKIEI